MSPPPATRPATCQSPPAATADVQSAESNEALAGSIEGGGEIKTSRTPEPTKRVLRDRRAKAAGSAEAPGSPLGENKTEFIPTPHDGMTIKAIANHFGVMPKPYLKWIRTFAPFGTGEEHTIRNSLKRKQTRLQKGTEVPVPNGNRSFIEIQGAARPKPRKRGEQQPHISTLENSSMLYCAMLTAETRGIITPKSWLDARKSKQWEEWNTAMNEEYEALLKNCTWTLTRRPQENKCNWINMDI